MSEPAWRTLGRYRLEELVGRGGMAEVWRAVDTKLSRAVALKVILADHAADRHSVERFLREAKVVASLDHPNILPVYDVGEEGGRPFLVMPYLDGGTLRDRMEGRPAPLASAAGWISQLAGALDAAHEAGILHRDVKPANVLLGKGDRLFLADFGIARMLEGGAGLTATGMVVGTPLYMAPEQAQGKPATPATDRYALAVIAYELLSGMPPFEGESPLSLMHQHVATPPPALSTKVSGLPAGLDAVFARALDKDPAHRHPTSSVFAAAIAAFAPTGSAGALPLAADPVSVAPTILEAVRPRPVATPPPGLTSEPTVYTGTGRARRKLAWGVAAAAVSVSALAGGLFLLRGKESPSASPRDEAQPVAASPAGPLEDSSKGKTGEATLPSATPQLQVAPEVSSKATAPAMAVSQAESPSKAGEPGTAGAPRLSPSKGKELRTTSAPGADAASASHPMSTLPEKSPVSSPRPAATSVTRGERPEEGPAVSAARKKLKAAFQRLDPSKKAEARLSKDDFSFAALAAREALKEDPQLAEARLLEIYSGGGLAYMAWNDEAASSALVETFVALRRMGRREFRSLAFLLRRPGGSILPPRGWELALGYGDARGEAEPLLDSALAANPNDAKALIGRAQLRRLQGRTSEFLADLKRAVAANPSPQVRLGVLDLLKAACRGGLPEACRAAESLAAEPSPPGRRAPQPR